LNPQKVWTSTPPTGWTVDNSFMPEPPGVRDWHGWTFANAQAWSYVAGDQRRSEFTNAKGVVAIADSDEWDDIKPHGEGLYETYLITPAISLTGVAANSLTMTFDSSWRPEGGQEVNIMASFDGGAPQEVLWWNSIAGDANFHSDESTNELVSVTINNPAGAKTMVLTWGYMYGSNNWFWAVDNIKSPVEIRLCLAKILKVWLWDHSWMKNFQKISKRLTSIKFGQKHLRPVGRSMIP